MITNHEDLDDTTPGYMQTTELFAEREQLKAIEAHVLRNWDRYNEQKFDQRLSAIEGEINLRIPRRL